MEELKSLHYMACLMFPVLQLQCLWNVNVRAKSPGHLGQPPNCHDALVTLAHVPWILSEPQC